MERYLSLLLVLVLAYWIVRLKTRIGILEKLVGPAVPSGNHQGKPAKSGTAQQSHHDANQTSRKAGQRVWTIS